ncbi:MAG: hypothetical protein KDN20_08485 [Verrucomicrobiae bacterium]|nr:hypothetical protein [Verrucomicrobiae bacterium]
MTFRFLLPLSRFLHSGIIALLLVPLLAMGADEAKTDEAKAPDARVTKVGEHTYQLGEISFDAKTREVRVPTVMNLREGGPIEYLLVHENGAVHESLLTTSVRGLHLQIVFKLLRYRTGEGDLFDAFLPEEERRQKIEGDAKTELGDPLSLVVEWEKDGETHEHPVSDWILDAETGKAMTDEPWILTGSHTMNGFFLADSEGSLVGVYLDQVALFNMKRKGAENDERWGANSAKTPEVGQAVTLVFRPAK